MIPEQENICVTHDTVITSDTLSLCGKSSLRRNVNLTNNIILELKPSKSTCKYYDSKCDHYYMCNDKQHVTVSKSEFIERCGGQSQIEEEQQNTNIFANLFDFKNIDAIKASLLLTLGFLTITIITLIIKIISCCCCRKK